MISRNELKVGDVVRFKLNFDHDRRTHIYTSVFDLFVERGVEWTITHIKAGTWHVTGNGVELVIEGHWFSEVQVPDEDVLPGETAFSPLVGNEQYRWDKWLVEDGEEWNRLLAVEEQVDRF